MSKQDHPSKYLSAFYPKPTQNPTPPRLPTPTTSSEFHDADKFKNPADFFKSSQSLSSQAMPSSQAKSSQIKRISFGGGSTHEMLSQSFQPKKPLLGQAGSCKTGFTRSMSPKKPFPIPMTTNKATISKPATSSEAFIKPFPAPQRKPYSLDQNAASTKALELQWTTKMRQAKKAGMEAQKLQGIQEKKMIRGDVGKSPMGKSLWVDSSFTKSDASCKNQQNDPWYSNDVWGDDLSIEAVDECLRVASTQEVKKSVETLLNDDTMSCWMNESWASPEKFSVKSPKMRPSSVKTALFSDRKEVKEKDDFMTLLTGDPSFMSFLDAVESQQKPSSSSSSSASDRTFSSQARTSPLLNLRGRHPSSQIRKIIPFSERLPVGTSSYVIKAKEFESPSKNEELTLSQRKLRKPTKSLPSPTPLNKHQTEWLRGQLEKKEGESRLLREKLKTAEEEVQKHKLEKTKELETLREAFENKVKQLERQLEATQVQAIFKAKEAESSLEKYRELKTVSVRTPEPPAVNRGFKNFAVGCRPGETLKTAPVDDTVSKSFLVEDTASTNDIIDESFRMTPTKSERMVEGTPEGSMFDETPVHSPVNEEKIETAEVVEPVKLDSSSGTFPNEFIFDDSFLERSSVFAKAVDRIIHGNQPKKELNHFLMPPMEYLHHALLQTEFSEQDFENYLVRRPTLVELWGTSYDAFGETILTDYEKAKVGDVVPVDPARDVLAKSRYYTTLENVHGVLPTLTIKNWGPREQDMAKTFVNLATVMTRELYATLGDPRFLQTTYTIYDRDPKILKDFLNSSELRESFDPLSPERWKNESAVELRRCLIIIGFLCSVDHITTRYIVNPKARSCGKTSAFYPPETNQNSTNKSKVDNDAGLKIVLKEGERKPNELKLMQMYRDLHSKKLTLVSELAAKFMPVVGESNVDSPDDAISVDSAGTSSEVALKTALAEVNRISEFRTDFNTITQSKKAFTMENFEEYKNSLDKLELTLNLTNLPDIVNKIQGGLNPIRISKLIQVMDKPKSDEEIVFTSKEWDKIPDVIMTSAKSEVLHVNLDGAIFRAPTNRCITNLEKQMMNLALDNIGKLQSQVKRSIDSDEPCDLDVTRFVCSSPDIEVQKTRKRKISIDDPGCSKMMKVADYQTPPFDKALYSQIQKPDPQDDEVIVLDTQTQVLDEDDQVTKFEKREKIAELKRKMLAEEKELETKHPSTSRHSFAPLRMTGRQSPSCEESADREMVMEIEKMFQSQKVEVLEESVWSSSESEGENEERLKTVSVTREDDVEIEFIPDLVKTFHHKLKNAGLLELLCEIFKEGGVLRFTHRLNGVMLGTVLMLQKIVMYQRREVEPYCSKLATIIREILYARPSPRIILEVNILLRYAVEIRGFTKMLCHNASQDTFVIHPEKVFFTRGACLLETLCIIVTYATDEDTDLQVYFELSSWVRSIICSQKKHMTSLYEQHNANRRRCMCITALNNTMVMIYHRALTLYRRLYQTHNVNVGQKQILEKIFVSGIQVLRLVYSYGSLPFLVSIKTQYHEYRQLLVWLKDMHDDRIFYDTFILDVGDLFVVTELLKDSRDPNPSPDNCAEPVQGSTYNSNKLWPYLLPDRLTNLSSSESEED